jgi:hypothetical protein
MSTPDNADQGHVILRTVLITIALSVLVASVVMWWWVRGTEYTDAMNGQTPTASADVSPG